MGIGNLKGTSRKIFHQKYRKITSTEDHIDRIRAILLMLLNRA